MYAFSSPHFWVSLIAALLMAGMVAVQDPNLRGLLVVPLMAAYFTSLALFGLEHEAATKTGWKRYLRRLLAEFEEQAQKAPSATPDNTEQPRKVSREALDYILSRTRPQGA